MRLANALQDQKKHSVVVGAGTSEVSDEGEVDFALWLLHLPLPHFFAASHSPT